MPIVGKGGRHLQESVLGTVGELARVSGVTMRPYMRELLPLLLDALKDASASTKREVAVSTLGQLVQSTGCAPPPKIRPSSQGTHRLIVSTLRCGVCAWAVGIRAPTHLLPLAIFS